MRHLSYANVVATLALFAALGGSAYAAVKITGKQVRNGSLTGKDIHNRSLSAVDFKKRVLKRGPTGPTGATGLTGPSGKNGAPGTARAYALVDVTGNYPGVNPPPVFVSAHTKGFTALSHPGTGVYCLTPAAGINPATTAAVASPDYGASIPIDAFAYLNHKQDDCGAGKFEVRTFHGGSPPGDSDSVGFSIIVP